MASLSKPPSVLSLAWWPDPWWLRSVDLGRIRFLATAWVRALITARVSATDAAVTVPESLPSRRASSGRSLSPMSPQTPSQRRELVEFRYSAARKEVSEFLSSPHSEVHHHLHSKL